MLQVFRNAAKGRVGKVIVGLIVITFVLFGAESIISIAGNSSPATVNGEDVSLNEYQRQLTARQDELASQYGPEMAAQLANSSYVAEGVLNSLIDQTLQAQLTKKLGFDVSDDQILASLADMTAFQVDGKFNQDQYQYLLATNGYTHVSFLKSQKAQTALTQMQSGIMSSAFTIDKAVEKYADLIAQEREVSYLVLNANDYLDQVVLSEKDIEDYYLENESDFLSEEKVDVSYIKIALADLAGQIEVTEEDVESAYQSYVASKAAETTLEISHILFSDGDDLTEQALAAVDRIKSGASFSDLAKELSDDPGSAEFGGSLGVLLPDVYVQEFYDAATSLKAIGDISEPVTTVDGVHLIRLDSINTATVKSLEEKRVELLAEIQLDRARNEILTLESDLADLAYTSDNIQEVADTFQTELLSSGWITRSSSSELMSDVDVAKAVFSSQVIDEGLMSDVVRTAAGDLIVAQKVNYEPEATKPLESVTSEIEETLKDIKANDLMKEAAASMIAQPVEFESPWSEATVITRQSSADLPSEVVEKAFELQAPDADGYTLGDVINAGTGYIVAVHNVENVAPTEDQMTLAQNFSDQMMGGAEYQILFNTVRNQAKIKLR